MPKNYMKEWDKLYKKHRSYGAPLSQMTIISRIFKNEKVKRILDLGCGGGRHLLYLVQRGFEVYGIDISGEAVKMAKTLLGKGHREANLRVGSIFKLPYKNNFFDGLISLRVMNHGKRAQIQKAIREIERVLRPGGLIFITVQRISIKGKKRGIRKINGLRVDMTDEYTYRPLEGPESGVVHCILDKQWLRKEFKNFNIKNIWIDYGREKWQRYYCLLGELKK